MNPSIKKRNIFYAKIAASLLVLVWLTWFIGNQFQDTAPPKSSVESTPRVLGSDTVVLASVHESLIDIEHNYYNHRHHLYHLIETGEASHHQAEALFVAQRVRDTIERAMEEANDIKGAHALLNEATAQASMLKAVDAFIIRAKNWDAEALQMLKQIEDSRGATTASGRDSVRKTLPLASSMKKPNTDISSEPGHFLVEQHFIRAYRALGYAKFEIDLERGGLRKL